MVEHFLGLQGSCRGGQKTRKKVLLAAKSPGFPENPRFLETETVGPWKGADSRELFDFPDLFVGVSK